MLIELQKHWLDGECYCLSKAEGGRGDICAHCTTGHLLKTKLGWLSAQMFPPERPTEPKSVLPKPLGATVMIQTKNYPNSEPGRYLCTCSICTRQFFGQKLDKICNGCEITNLKIELAGARKDKERFVRKLKLIEINSDGQIVWEHLRSEIEENEDAQEAAMKATSK